MLNFLSSFYILHTGPLSDVNIFQLCRLLFHLDDSIVCSIEAFSFMWSLLSVVGLNVCAARTVKKVSSCVHEFKDISYFLLYQFHGIRSYVEALGVKYRVRNNDLA